MLPIPYGKQNISREDVEAVLECLQSDFLTQGPKVPEFEILISNYCRVRYAVAVNSATSALHIACLALGVKPGDRVWTSAITFVASSNAALYCGATIDFVDIDIRTINLCSHKLEEKLVQAEKAGALPKVVIPVHMCGQSCDMKRISKLSHKYGFRIIEDASHAVGASYKTNRVGSCEFSDITVFSYHPVKMITTGEGGMALSNDSELANSMRLLRSHGVTKDFERKAGKPIEGWYYEQQMLGFNYRMSDISAALGCSQMKRLDKFVESRRLLAERYKTLLSNLPLELPWEHHDAKSSYHLYVITLNNAMRTKRQCVFDALRDAGIGVNVHYIPVYFQPYYKKLGFARGYCKNAESYYSRCITLPIFPTLTLDQQDYVASSLGKALSS